ncbi:hypothetical protein MPSEU_000145700 [Mayamaea pseudoterrestris]|nr:hypothetical protein MPSEU_000145700 [Mayamaea pseudoterrestris]
MAELTPISSACMKQDEEEDAQELRPLVATGTEKVNSSRSLPTEIRLLFGLIGVSLALPMMALMYLVNTQVKLPLSLLPAYGAVCFMPYSLKPLYAILSQCYQEFQHEWNKCGDNNYQAVSNANRSNVQSATFKNSMQLPLLLPILFLLQALALVGTLFATSITTLFVAGLARGIAGAWPEFLLELELVRRVSHIDSANHGDDDSGCATSAEATSDATPATIDTATTDETYMASDGDPPLSNCASAASILQSQAATARSLGSWAGHVVALLLMSVSTTSSMSWGMAAWLLGTTALLNVLGSCYAWYYRVGAHVGDETNDDATIDNTEESPPLCNGLLVSDDFSTECDAMDGEEMAYANKLQTQGFAGRFHGKAVVCILQLCVIVLVLQGPMVASSFSWIWYTAMAIVVFIFVASIMVVTMSEQPATYRVGLFLIMRHSMPTASYLLASFVYELFEANPVVIQILSVLDMGILTLASWSYGVLFGQHGMADGRSGTSCNRNRYNLYHVMIGTTVAAAVVSLVGQLVLISTVPTMSSIVKRAVTVLVVRSLGNIVGEWKFLPDVVLATVASSTPMAAKKRVTKSINREEHNVETVKSSSTVCSNGPKKDTLVASGIQYGSLISCIDFGGQLNGLIVGILVNALGISRENGWKNLDRLVEVASLSTFLSVGLIFFLLRPRL